MHLTSPCIGEELKFTFIFTFISKFFTKCFESKTYRCFSFVFLNQDQVEYRNSKDEEKIILNAFFLHQDLLITSFLIIFKFTNK